MDVCSATNFIADPTTTIKNLSSNIKNGSIIRVTAVIFIFLTKIVVGENLLGFFSRTQMLKTVTLQLQQVKLRSVTVFTIQDI